MDFMKGLFWGAVLLKFAILIHTWVDPFWLEVVISAPVIILVIASYGLNRDEKTIH